MNKLSIIPRYLKYFLKAKSKYYLHSPFVYELAEAVIFDKRDFYAFEDIAYIRSQLLQNHHIIDVKDYGAGSKSNAKNRRKVSTIVKNAATPEKVGNLLFRLVNHFKPATLLELGTSLGIGTLYHAFAASKSQIYTIEGCPNTAKIAQETFHLLQLANIHSKIGQFEAMLQPTLEEIKQLDYAFLDGNHRKDATLQYFEQCLPYAHNDSVFVFDDINWSSDMQAAWTAIKAHPKVTLTIDLFRLGIVFFRAEQAEKEHFQLYF